MAHKKLGFTNGVDTRKVLFILQAVSAMKRKLIDYEKAFDKVQRERMQDNFGFLLAVKTSKLHFLTKLRLVSY